MKKKLLQNSKALDKIVSQTEKDIIKAYQSSLKEIRNTLAKAYEKYDMDMHNMQKYKRLERLEKSIMDEMSNISRQSSKSIRRGIKKSYEESFYRTGFALETELQVKLAYKAVNPKIIKNVIDNNISGLKWIERMGKNRADTIYQIKQELAQGLIQGEGYQKMARRLKHRLDIDANKAVTIARTEAGRARSEGSQDSMEHAQSKGLEIKKRWVSTVDDGTRDSHQDLDGEVVGIDEPFSNGLMYPRDASGEPEEVINCRCEHIVEFEGLEPTERRIRDEGIVPYTTYEEWMSNRVSK